MDFKVKGLTNEEVIKSRKEHGDNVLNVRDGETFFQKFLGSFKDPIIIILTVALAIYTVLAVLGYTHWYEAVGIAVAVLIATLVATFSEYKNETSFQKLQEEASQITNKVYRDGNLVEISVNDVVVGDLVVLQPGDKVPADGRLIQGNCKVNQASLTGEPDDVKKFPQGNNVVDEGDLLTQYKVFRGTVVTDGEAVMQVEKVGAKTVYGALNEELGEADRESPLTVKLQALAKGISTFGYIGATLIAVAYMFNKIVLENNWDTALMSAYFDNIAVLVTDLVAAFILAVIIIVVAVPEGLPMMIAFVLSANMRKLLNSKVLVRKLNGIETAGSMNILFTDKTGTLTKGELEAVVVLDGDGTNFKSVSDMSPSLKDAIGTSVRNNTSSVLSKDEEGKVAVVGGNPTDKALLTYFKQVGHELEPSAITSTVTFNSERKFSATNTAERSYAKGAVEVLLDKCSTFLNSQGETLPLTQEGIQALQKQMDELSARSIRLIAVVDSESEFTEELNNVQGLRLLGIVGIRDDLREDSKEAVLEAKKAGIHVVMVTGDKKETAQAIAHEVGIIDSQFTEVITSTELRAMTDDQVKEMLPRLAVVARALPTDKSRLVRIAQSLNLVVGMTGDGVNDSAALSIADVGFAMGSGTEVAKEASSIILLADNFSAINEAVLYGRTIYNTIRKFIVFQMTVNVAALGISFIGPLFGVEMPLTMIQMLWVNLVMDTLAVLAFGGEAALKRYMEEKPKRRDEAIINGDMWSSILINGLAMAGMSIAFLKVPYFRELFSSEAVFLSAFFALFIFWNNFNKFNARTDRLNLFDHMSENKGFLKIVGLIFAVQVIFTYIGGDILRTVGLSLQEWVIVLAMAVIIIPIDLLRKIVRDLISKK